MTPPAQADLRRATDTGVGHPLQPEAVAADLLALLSRAATMVSTPLMPQQSSPSITTRLGPSRSARRPD